SLAFALLRRRCCWCGGSAARKPRKIMRCCGCTGGRHRLRPFRRAHLTETTARPLAPHPRHLTRDMRSSNLGVRTELELQQGRRRRQQRYVMAGGAAHSTFTKSLRPRSWIRARYRGSVLSYGRAPRQRRLRLIHCPTFAAGVFVLGLALWLYACSRAVRLEGFFLIAFDHRGERVRRLRRAVSGIGQPVEIASQTMKLRSDGLRCHPFGCPASFSGFPPVVP